MLSFVWLRSHGAATLSTTASAKPCASQALLAACTIHPGASTLTVVTKRTKMRAALLLTVTALRLVKFRVALVLRHLRTILLIHLWPILRLPQLLAILATVIGIPELGLVVLCTKIGRREA